MKKIKKVLLKDIIIPKGTILNKAPVRTERYDNDHFSCVIGLSDNTVGYFEYCIDSDFLEEVDDYFTDCK